MTDYLCDYCGGPTDYAAFSGGTEYRCLSEECGNQQRYREDADPATLPRAVLLRTPEGRERLREDMRAEISSACDSIAGCSPSLPSSPGSTPD